MKRKHITKILLPAVLCSSILLSGCTFKQNKTQENKKKSTQISSILDDDKKMGYKKNEIEDVPAGYIQDCENQGTIRTLEYTAKDYTGTGGKCTKQARVYLPHGYDESKEYPVFYLMHGGGDDEEWYFGDTSKTINSFLGGILDHMIAGGDLEPCIVCTPTYKNEYCQDDSKCTEVFYRELVNDLIPALEGKYATAYGNLCRNSKKKELKSASIRKLEEATRLERGFGGFSMGSVTTWNVFQHCLREVGFFMPISGEAWGIGNSEEQAKVLSDSVKKQKLSWNDFRLFAGCGGKTDIAHSVMTSMLKQMKKQDRMFHYTENFSDGNYYYGVWKDGGHDVNTVCTMVYNGLPQFFEKTKDYKMKWAKNILSGKLPAKVKKKDENADYGKWVTKSYYSRTAERQTKMNVLLPAYYDKEKSYPVLYLLHGYYDDQNWMKDRTDLKMILGNMMTKGLTKEMIVVCPYIFCSNENAVCTEMNLENSLAYDNFINDLEKDVIPFVKQTFSVSEGKENTAIAGFSMGGREALYIGIQHPEQFGYIGAVCPAPGLVPGADTSQHPGQLKEDELKFDETKETPYMLYMAGANEDGAVGDNPEQLHALLNKNKVDHIWQLFDGTGHDERSVELYLYNYMQMIFK